MNSRLLWKFLGINLIVIGIVILILWLAIKYLAADYFMTLMQQYNISPAVAHEMFLTAVYRYLILGSLFAFALAVILGLLLTKQALSPLSQMIKSTTKIASGDYTARVHVSSKDEIGQLARAFNQMTHSLDRYEQLRRSMLLDLAHEIRTPLTNMQGYLEALSDEVVAPSKEYFESLHEETLRLVKLVEELFQLARVDATKAPLHLEEINLRDLIADFLNLFRLQFVEKEINLEIHFATKAERITADADKLRQVMYNLLQNALQYTPRGENVSISTECPPGQIKVTVANSGAPIPEEDIPFIFERFYRSEKSPLPELGRAGIGLAIVKELIEVHGGHVGAESVSGETRIWFVLPVKR